MPFSSLHRFHKANGVHYNTKLNVKEVAEISKIPVEVLQRVFDDEHKRCGYTPTAMLAVYSYAIGGKVFKQYANNKSEPLTNVNQ